MNHKKVWLAIFVGSLAMFLYNYMINSTNPYVIQIVAGVMVVNVIFIIIGAYIGGFILSKVYKYKIVKLNRMKFL